MVVFGYAVGLMTANFAVAYFQVRNTENSICATRLSLQVSELDACYTVISGLCTLNCSIKFGRRIFFSSFEYMRGIFLSSCDERIRRLLLHYTALMRYSLSH